VLLRVLMLHVARHGSAGGRGARLAVLDLVEHRVAGAERDVRRRGRLCSGVQLLLQVVVRMRMRRAHPHRRVVVEERVVLHHLERRHSGRPGRRRRRLALLADAADGRLERLGPRQEPSVVLQAAEHPALRTTHARASVTTSQKTTAF